MITILQKKLDTTGRPIRKALESLVALYPNLFG